MQDQQSPRRGSLGPLLLFLGITFAVLGAIAVAVYATSGGSATAMRDLAYLFMGLAIPVGLAILVIGLVVSRVRRNRGGSKG